MKRFAPPLILLLLMVGSLWAENPADLPAPTSYVNDFAHVLTPDGSQKIEDLCLQVHQKADADWSSSPSSRLTTA